MQEYGIVCPRYLDPLYTVTQHTLDQDFLDTQKNSLYLMSELILPVKKKHILSQ